MRSRTTGTPASRYPRSSDATSRMWGVAAVAAEYTAEWTVADLPAIGRTVIRASPDRLRPRLAMRVVRRIVRNTYGGSRALVRWRGDRGEVDIRGSVFCE